MAGRLDGCLGAEPGEVVIAVAEGPFADDGDRPTHMGNNCKHSRTKDKGWYSIWGVERGSNTSSPPELSSHKILHTQAYLGL